MARLAIRLTYGIPGAAVDLAREAGAGLLRGDYCHLAREGLCEPKAIEAASEEQLLACLDGDRRKLGLVRDGAAAITGRRDTVVTAPAPVLEAYVA